LRSEPPSPELETTILIDEAFVKLVGAQDCQWENRAQFFCCAAKVMGQLLVDDARRRTAAKRGGGQRVASLEQVPEPSDPKGWDPDLLIDLHDAIAKLTGTYPDPMQIAELHLFAGMDLKQIAADILHVPYTTVKRRWQRAYSLLHRAMSGGE